MTETRRSEVWSSGLPMAGNLIISSSVLLFSRWLLSEGELGSETFRSTFRWLLATLLSLAVFGVIELLRLRRDNKATNDKIHRDLVRTNAVIPDRRGKLSITASIVTDFPDEREFSSILADVEGDRYSIDVVRMFSYQNLIMTPQYLHYLFFSERDIYKRRSRVVVVDSVCQATLVYLLLSMCSRHRTHVISNRQYRKFIRKRCGRKGGYSRVAFRKMIKGNPSMVKIGAKKGDRLWGKYTDFRDNGVTRSIQTRYLEKSWQLLELLVDEARLLEDRRELFSVAEVQNALDRDARAEHFQSRP